MPLSAAAPRKHLHNRDITLRGYLRDDGLIDIEARLTDTKTYASTRDDGSPRGIGDPVHDMWLRMTIDLERQIVGCEAAMDATPFAICPGAAVNFSRLVGLRIEGGFIRAALARVGGGEGCTHLRELLQQMGTVAFQTLYSVGKLSDDPGHLGKHRPPLLNTCFAWRDTGEMVAERFPDHYKQTAESASF
jgi:hypothetical protein